MSEITYEANIKKLWDALDNVTAALENVMLHHAEDMTTGDIGNRNVLIQKAKDLLEMTDTRNEFDVKVCRVGYGFRTIRVKASDGAEAERLALDRAGDHEYSEKSSDYSAESVTLVEE